MNDARVARHWFAAAGFLVLFVAGTALVVYNSVGKQAETTMLTASQVDAVAERRVAIKASLDRADRMLAEAQAKLAAECGTGKGKRCEGIQATIGVYEAAVKGHVADLEKLGPTKVAHANSTEMAKAAALFGADEAKASAFLSLLVPFFRTAFFEVGAIISLGFAFRRGAQVKVEAAKVQAITEKPEGQITDKELEELRRIYAKPRLSLSNDDLAKKLGVSKSESSKRASKAVAAGILTRVPHGREVRLQLASAGQTLN
jgi:hypothetical protein